MRGGRGSNVSTTNLKNVKPRAAGNFIHDLFIFVMTRTPKSNNGIQGQILDRHLQALATVLAKEKVTHLGVGRYAAPTGVLTNPKR